MTRFVCGLGIALGILLGAHPGSAQESLSCPYRGSDPAARRSPLDSAMFQVDGHDVKVCYGRPSARGRTMIGGNAVPFGEIWRTGADETTKIRSAIALSIAGIDVEVGTYALYTVPGEREWQIIVNRAWQQWGRENYYSDEVRAQEVGRATVPVERVEDHIETFTIRTEPANDGVYLIMEWEHTRVRIPIAAGS